MLELLGIVLFALLIGLSIALHEVGHLLPAKKFGVKVTEYMIGFGPSVWSRVKGETRYGLKAVPLGGYIRMIGMLPPATDGTSRSMSTGRFAAMVNDARKQSVDEIQPGEEARAFYRLPVRKRVVIMMGGPTMNLILAFILFAIVLVGIGIPQATMQVSDVSASRCPPATAPPARRRHRPRWRGSRPVTRSSRSTASRPPTGSRPRRGSARIPVPARLSPSSGPARRSTSRSPSPPPCGPFSTSRAIRRPRP